MMNVKLLTENIAIDTIKKILSKKGITLKKFVKTIVIRIIELLIKECFFGLGLFSSFILVPRSYGFRFRRWVH